MTALLQLLDRAGVLYGELARFVLRMLGYKVPAGPSYLALLLSYTKSTTFAALNLSPRC